MGSNPSNFKKGDNYPVECVSWNDIQSFLTELNKLTGKKYALPTEAQWEYAACGGAQSKGHKYSGSDTIDDVAWYGGSPSLVYRHTFCSSVLSYDGSAGARRPLPPTIAPTWTN